MQQLALIRQTVVDRLAQENASEKLKAKEERLRKKAEARTARMRAKTEKSDGNKHLVVDYLTRRLPYVTVDSQAVDVMTEREFTEILRKAKRYGRCFKFINMLKHDPPGACFLTMIFSAVAALVAALLSVSYIAMFFFIVVIIMLIGIGIFDREE